jgi:hypothetical protein
LVFAFLDFWFRVLRFQIIVFEGGEQIRACDNDFSMATGFMNRIRNILCEPRPAVAVYVLVTM